MLEKKTVVLLFDDMDAVRGAIAELENAGIPHSDIKMVDSRDLKSEPLVRGESGINMTNLLRRLFGTNYEPHQSSPLYAEWMRNGGVLVAVNTDEKSAATLTTILESYATKDAAGRMRQAVVEEKAAGTVESRSLLGRETRPAVRAEEIKDDRTLEVIDEELHVGKRKVQKGSVRVVKHVVESPVEETIELRDEIVTIDRRPLDRIATEADLKELADFSVEITETAEEPVVSKEARVKEEIRISRKVVGHQQKITDKIKKTEVHIEGLEPAKLRELEFRKDFTAKYGSSGRNYSDYARAYEFGSVMADDDRYRNREWADIENEARKQWEVKQQGSWKDFAEAVRTGWHSIRRRAA
jgi:uncharacterized protein (TIGR02271 family)